MTRTALRALLMLAFALLSFVMSAILVQTSAMKHVELDALNEVDYLHRLSEASATAGGERSGSDGPAAFAGAMWA